eukprot:6196308-Pleurochrysis_carterae.AAC.1
MTTLCTTVHELRMRQPSLGRPRRVARPPDSRRSYRHCPAALLQGLSANELACRHLGHKQKAAYWRFSLLGGEALQGRIAPTDGFSLFPVRGTRLKGERDASSQPWPTRAVDCDGRLGERSPRAAAESSRRRDTQA